MNVWGSGFIPILIYSDFNAGGGIPSTAILTESGLEIETESGQDILTET